MDNVAPQIEAKLNKEVKPLRAHDTLLDLLEEVVERHDLAPALLRAHEQGFARISYRAMDELSYSVRWEVDGASHNGTTTTTTWPNDTVPASQTNSGETWTCHALSNDGYEDGGEGSSAGVTIVNEPYTYTITKSMLNSLTSDCSSSNDRPYGCNGVWGFTWTDTEGLTPSAVDVDMSLGVMCGAGTRTVELNGTQIGSITSVDDCQCNGTVDAVAIAASTASSYNVGGVNTLTVNDAGSCEGLMHNANWGSDAYGQVTLTY